jgi:hypothetical protein
MRLSLSGGTTVLDKMTAPPTDTLDLLSRRLADQPLRLDPANAQLQRRIH